MSLSIASQQAATAHAGGWSLSPTLTRLMLVLLTLAALAAGFMVTNTDAAARAATSAGSDLVRLLRAMAGLKLLIAAGLSAAILWRLGTPARAGWFVAYAAASAAAWAGPGLIWQMAHVGLGALLLHGGLLASVLLLWRDPAVGEQLGAMLAARRARLREVP